MIDRVAYIVDGSFFTKKFKAIYKKFPSANSLESYIQSIQKYIRLKEYILENSEIYRIFFYDCKPIKETLTNPINRLPLDLSKTPSFKNNESLHDGLKKKHYFALRFGELKLARETHPWRQWRVKEIEKLKDRKMNAKDLTPEITQKGVDMRMGLDVASITSKKLCTKIVLLSGDTDMIPAMKFARKEGVHVFLHTFDLSAHNAMVAHADIIVEHREINFSLVS